MPFDLRLIESFVNVAETLSFSQAAQRANTVQSAVSAHIRALEDLTHRSHVNRGRGQPVTLTAEGAAFLVQARRLLLLAEDLRHPASLGAGAQPLRLGTTVTFALSVVLRALVAADATLTSVTVRTARSHDLMSLLETGQIDMALVLDQGPHPLRQGVAEVDLVWAGAASLRTVPEDPLPLAFLDDARDLRRYAYAALDGAGQVARTRLTTHPDPIGLRAVLQAGLGVTLLPRPALTGSLVDVGPRLGLPPLRRIPVSIYAARSVRAKAFDRVSRAILAELKAA